MTAVLVHGAGHTSSIWQETQASLHQPSFAVNLPGRSGKDGDLAGLTVSAAARSVAEDIETFTTGDVIIVGHSISGTILPSVAAKLPNRVRGLVFVAGITANEDQLPAEIFAPEHVEAMTSMLARLRARHAGVPYEGLERKAAHQLDSLNLSCEPMRWMGLPTWFPRTFVRPLRDELQSRHVQSALIQSSGAQRVIDIDSSHTPAADAPGALAAVISDLLGP